MVVPNNSMRPTRKKPRAADAERSASLALCRQATTTALLKVMAQNVEEGLAARGASA
jgi:hypothetical protein